MIPPQPPKDEELVDVELLMLDGKRYVFPGVQWKTLWLFIQHDSLETFPQLGFVNYQKSCLTILTENLLSIAIEGQVYWTRPPS